MLLHRKLWRFQLIHAKTHKYLGHFTKADIAELEKKYARRKPRKTKKSTATV